MGFIAGFFLLFKSRVTAPKDLVAAFFDRVYNRQDLGFVLEAFTDDYTEHRENGARTNREAVAILISARETFPDLSVVVADLVAEGDLVAARAVFTGTPVKPYAGAAPVPRKIVWEAMEFFRFREGRICESWGSWPNDEITGQMRPPRGA